MGTVSTRLGRWRLEELGVARRPGGPPLGRDDRTQPPARSEDLARRIPGARLVVLPGGHTPPVERPEEFNAALVPFLRRLLAAHMVARGVG